MEATPDPLKLKRTRRIVWYIIFVFFFFGIVLENSGFKCAGQIAFMLILLTLVEVLLLGYRIRRNEQAGLIAKEELKLQPYWKILSGNLLFSGFVLLICSTSALLAGFAGLIVIGVLLPMALSAGKGSRELRRQRWTRFLIYAIAVSAGWVLDYQANGNEQRNFNNIIVAVEQYKATEGRYPENLEQLAPEHLAAVPAARFGRFIYRPDNPDDARLSHVTMPFVHESYSFKSKTRKTWD